MLLGTSPYVVKLVVVVVLLLLLWGWETWRPFFDQRAGRLRHGFRNLALALLSTLLVAGTFGLALVSVVEWTRQHQAGLFHALDLTWPWRLGLALLLLDGWMYVWHRANHIVPLLWRFHRMHHSDDQMDVTSAVRFHPGEQLMAGGLRLALVPLLGLELWHLLLYDTLLLLVTQLHHANISLGRWDRLARLLIVTPDMHKVHHSRVAEETHSNFAVVLSVWDRLARTFRLRGDPSTIHFGLDDLTDPSWQTLPGMLRTPFCSLPKPEASSSWREGSPSEHEAVVSGR